MGKPTDYPNIDACDGDFKLRASLSEKFAEHKSALEALINSRFRDWADGKNQRSRRG
jgi:hypothetical protein